MRSQFSISSQLQLFACNLLDDVPQFGVLDLIQHFPWRPSFPSEPKLPPWWPESGSSFCRNDLGQARFSLPHFRQFLPSPTGHRPKEWLERSCPTSSVRSYVLERLDESFDGSVPLRFRACNNQLFGQREGRMKVFDPSGFEQVDDMAGELRHQT